MKLNWKYTFVLGIGFFGVSIVWPIYNLYMPLLYDKYLDSDALIGSIMTIDNWFALFLLPIIGVMSDRTRTRFGRRIPYLLVGAPLSALFLALIPLGWSTGFWALLTVTILMNLSMATWRSPIVALMPDVTPAELRSRANGIINFMGGFGYIAATFGGSILYKMYPGYPFFASALFLIAVALAFFLWIREPADATTKTERYAFGMVYDPNAWLLLGAIFFWFIGYNSVETWITTYGTKHLGQEAAKVGGLMTFAGAAFLLTALPAGYVAEGMGKWRGFGRKWTILAGLLLISLSWAYISQLKDLSAGIPFLALTGFSWALININSLPMVAQLAPAGQMGTYTGMYYLASSGANIAGPPLFGLLFDNFGYGVFFPTAIGFMILAACCMLAVVKGERPIDSHKLSA